MNLREEDLDSGADTEDAEDNEEFPCDVGEAWGDEETQGEVEEPVTDSGNTLVHDQYPFNKR